MAWHNLVVEINVYMPCMAYTRIPNIPQEGLQQQLVLFQSCHNFVLSHASIRQPLLVPEPTYGSGSARLWRPCTPAMAAGLTDHVWTLREVLQFRVPPWAQPVEG